MSHFEAHFPHYHLARTGEMGKVFFSHSVGSFAGSLVSVFIPIFLLKNGYSFSAVLFYLMMQQAFAVFLQLPTAQIVGRFGANRITAIATLFGVVLFALLLTVPEFHWSVWILAAVWAVNRSLYWIPFHANFSTARKQGKTGVQLSALNALNTLGNGIAPAIGGIVATAFGIRVIYIAAMIIFIISTVPLWFGKELVRKRSVDFSRLDIRKIRPDLYANAFNSISICTNNNVWPMLISLMVTSYAGIGVLSSVITIAMITISLYVGRREAVKGERHYLKEGLNMATGAGVLRLLAQNGGHIFGINFLSGISQSLYHTPFMTRYYAHSDEEPRFEYLVAMEMACCLGAAIYFAILWALSFFLPMETVLLIGLGLSIPAVYGIRLMR